MEYNTGTMVAARHHGRKMVLNHCYQGQHANYKQQIENTTYNSEQLFGEMPLSAHHYWWTERKEVGHIYVKGGPVPKEIYTGPPTGKSKGKTSFTQQGRRSFSQNSRNASHSQRGKFCPGGNNNQQGNKKRGGGAKRTANQKRTTQQNPPNTAKNTKSKKNKKK